MKFDKMQCSVALAGDVRHVVYVGEEGTLTWPEVNILRVIHGEHAVTNIKVIGEGEISDPTIERERLVMKYPKYADVADVRDIIGGPRDAHRMHFKAPDFIARFDDEIEVVTINRRTGATSATSAAPDPAETERNVAPKKGSFTARKAEGLAKARAASAAKAKAKREAQTPAEPESTAA